MPATAMVPDWCSSAIDRTATVAGMARSYAKNGPHLPLHVPD
jgi:hypothetical protein